MHPHPNEGRAAARTAFPALIGAFTLGAGVVACDRPEPSAGGAAPDPPAVAIDLDDPQVCKNCHGAVVAEWETSMHAHAHHDADPIYAAMRTARMAREGEAIATRCASCHGPRDTADPESAVARVGVGCASCHAIAELDDHGGTRRGAGAITWSTDGVLRGPHDATQPSPHGTGPAAPWVVDGTSLCLACHGEMKNAQGVPTCTTGVEHAALADGASCTSCHMPEVEGASGIVSTRGTHRSHAFLGPHHALEATTRDAGLTFLAGGVRAEAALDGRVLRATVENTAGHAFPTGYPGRVVVVSAVGFDRDGRAAWRNAASDALAEDPAAVLHKAYVDAAGQPAMPPFSVALARDTRLAPNERRTFEWRLPRGVVRAEVTLVYRLLPERAARALGLEGRPEAEPIPFLRATTASEGAGP